MSAAVSIAGRPAASAPPLDGAPAGPTEGASGAAEFAGVLGGALGSVAAATPIDPTSPVPPSDGGGRAGIEVDGESASAGDLLPPAEADASTSGPVRTPPQRGPRTSRAAAEAPSPLDSGQLPAGALPAPVVLLPGPAGGPAALVADPSTGGRSTSGPAAVSVAGVAGAAVTGAAVTGAAATGAAVTGPAPVGGASGMAAAGSPPSGPASGAPLSAAPVGLDEARPAVASAPADSPARLIDSAYAPPRRAGSADHPEQLPAAVGPSGPPAPTDALPPGLAPAQSVGQPVAPAAPAPAAEASPVAAPPAAQPGLGAALGRLRHKVDGTSELTVALHPAELGSVGVTATVRDGLLTLTVSCADRAAHDAVSAALPTLRHDLAAAGFTGVDVGFGDRGAQPDSHRAPPPGVPSGSGREVPADPAPPRHAVPTRPLADRGLDRWL